MEISAIEFIGLIAIGGAIFWVGFQLSPPNTKEIKVDWVSPKVKNKAQTSKRKREKFCDISLDKLNYIQY